MVGYSNKNTSFQLIILVPQMRGLTKFSLRTTKPVRNTVLDLSSGTTRYMPLPWNMLRSVNSLTRAYGQPFDSLSYTDSPVSPVSRGVDTGKIWYAIYFFQELEKKVNNSTVE